MKDNKFYKSIYLEALARQHADYLIGINITRVFTTLMREHGINDVFPIGRIKSVLTSMIYDREIHIETFKPKPYWDLTATFKVNNSVYEGKWFNEKQEHIIFKQQASNLSTVLRDGNCYVLSKELDVMNQRPPQFYNLSSLMMTANNRFKYSPKSVLGIAQSLYEKGFISYPRSSSVCVTEEEAEEFPEILKRLSELPEYRELIPVPKESIMNDKRYINPAEVDDHYALIPTIEVPDITKLSQQEFNIYNLIALSLISAHYEDSETTTAKIVTVANDYFTFLTQQSRVTKQGWRKVLGKDFDEEYEESRDKQIPIPNVEVNDTGRIVELDIDEGSSKPKPRLSLGGLVGLMKNANTMSELNDEHTKSDYSLGTAATRAGIIEEIIKQNYIEIRKNLVYITKKGRLLVESLNHSNSILTSPELTAQWEGYLEGIGKGEKTYSKFMEQAIKLTSNTTEKIIMGSKSWDIEKWKEQIDNENSVGNCLICGSPMVERKDFYGCSNYKITGCSFSISKLLKGKKLPKSTIREFLNKGKTGYLTGFLDYKERTYQGCLKWDENQKKILFFKEGDKG